jgi:pimeloyl-ACP methyl ester carboxylesterase
MHLSVERIDGASATRDVVFLHGILGRGANLRTLAKRFVAALPGWSAVLVDLRGHGGSKDVPPGEPATLARCAEDLLELFEASGRTPGAIFGHCFGGKIALELASRALAAPHYVIVDSQPGPRTDARGSETTLEVLALLRGRSGPFPTRQAFVAAMVAGGQPSGIAEWLGTSLRKDEDGFRFAIDLELVDGFLRDYFARDLWPAVEAPPEGSTVHLVVGDRSSVYDPASRSRAAALAAAGPVTVDVVPAGHWVHVDAPDALLEVLVRRLGGGA